MMQTHVQHIIPKKEKNCFCNIFLKVIRVSVQQMHVDFNVSLLLWNGSNGPDINLTTCATLFELPFPITKQNSLHQEHGTNVSQNQNMQVPSFIMH